MRRLQILKLRARFVCALTSTTFLWVGNSFGQVAFQNDHELYEMGTAPVDVLIADILGPDSRDLVTADRDSGQLSIRLNDGTGDFGPITSVELDPLLNDVPGKMAVGDFDGDGDLDFFVVNSVVSGPGVSYIENQSGINCNQTSGLCFADGIFTPSPGKAPVSCVALGDVDDDGDLDLVVGKLSTSGSNSITVHFGVGDGTLDSSFVQIQLGAGDMVRDLAVADLNDDGFADIVGAIHNPNPSINGGWITVILSNGDGTFTGNGVYFDNNARSTAPVALDIADVDGDGVPDVVTSNQLSNNAWVFIGDGFGAFDDPVTYSVGASPRDIKARYLNGDNDIDLVVANGTSEDVTILLNNGSGVFTATTCQPYSVSPGEEPVALDVADVDFDGRPDFITANIGTDDVAIVTQEIIGDIYSSVLSGAGQDRVVDGADLARLLSQWGACGSICEGDLNCSGTVDGADLAALLANWSDTENPPQLAIAPESRGGNPAGNETMGFDDDVEAPQASASNVPWVLAALGFESIESYLGYINGLDATELFEHIVDLLEVIQNENE